MAKVNVVYIGEKAVKKDTITGSRLRFVRNQPVAIDDDIASKLLMYPDVWVLEDDAKACIAKRKKTLKEQDEIQKDKEKALADAQLCESFVVSIDEEFVDLEKFTSGKLATIVEAQDLVITQKKSPIEEYRRAIREALHVKNGVPTA
ncbi:MAG: hypothetical protein HRU25_14840 [Psychrobium sp.]|nr:hypothetical protein [Psychrobium sp.]